LQHCGHEDHPQLSKYSHCKILKQQQIIDKNKQTEINTSTNKQKNALNVATQHKSNISVKLAGPRYLLA